VLVPGGIAGFVEPGAYHSEHPFSQAEMQNSDVLELDIVIDDIWNWARCVGFSHIRFRPFTFPTVDLSFRDRNGIARGIVPRHLKGEMRRSLTSWSIFFLYKGAPVLDSRGVNGLDGALEIVSAPATVPAGKPFEVRVRCTNIGAAVWLGQDAYQNVGSVRVGPHLYDANMKLLNFEVLRHELPQAVLPAQSTDEFVQFAPLPPGEYVLTFDLVAEFVCWFESLGHVPPRVNIAVR
jgi:hypothetical protein